LVRSFKENREEIVTEERLKSGDIIIVSTVLTGLSEYPVLRIEGNKAITRFRDFNAKIYPGGNIYEFGKSPNATTNGYWIKRNNKVGEKT
jgi:hypothetical protein